MLDSLITSKTRVRLLLKFFSNPMTQGYLRGLAEEFGESTNAVRIELNRLAGADLLTSESIGRKKLYRANARHPLYPELRSLTRKYLGLDRIEHILENLGKVRLALITGDYARGRDTGIIDLTIVGEVKADYLAELIKKAENAIERRIRTLVLSEEEYRSLKATHPMDKALVIWNEDGNM